MTILHTREAWNEFECGSTRDVGDAVQATVVAVPRQRTAAASRRPRSSRPGGAPVRYRGTGVLVSRASHRRPVTPATTVALALIAGMITLWLGLVAQFGGIDGGDAEVPARLAVVQVQAGESLQQVAERVAPDAPFGEVVKRIRALNELESAALNAGQTLIAPVS